MIDKKEYIRLIKNISRRVANIENKGFETAATKRFREVFGNEGFYKIKGIDEKTLQKNLQTLKYLDTLKTSRVLTDKDFERIEGIQDFFDNENQYKIYDFIDELSNNQLSKNYKYQLIDFSSKYVGKKMTKKRIERLLEELKEEFPNVQFKKLVKA